MATRKLSWWVRVGDAGEYEPFGTLSEAADAIRDTVRGGDGPLQRYIGPALRGIEFGEYRGNNGISLFRGDSDAQFSREATHNEMLDVFGECGDMHCTKESE